MTARPSSLTSIQTVTEPSTTKSKTTGELKCLRFMEVLLPCDDLYMRSEVTQRKSRDCPVTAMLCSAVERELAFLLEKEIEYHQQLEILKRDLLRRYDWTNQVAFNSVDSMRDGFFAFNSLIHFCRSNGYNASECEVIAMIRRLDVDADQRVTYDEFCRAMTPISHQ